MSKPKILLCPMLMLLASCTTSTTENKWCAADSIITVSKADKFTPGTAREILLHNDVGTRICGW